MSDGKRVTEASVSVVLVEEEKDRKVSWHPTTSRGKLFISHPRSIHVNNKFTQNLEKKKPDLW
jgi:hypothetical protein